MVNNVPVQKEKKPMADDIVVRVSTEGGYVRNKVSSGDAAVTIERKYNMYKVSNNFRTNKRNL